ncbi:MAG: LLM class flavin-dependent oxidoreductase [Solirubrobacterales bacterium]|nr:LLM class flavin-dependent oxidoreductase [Solirubrobacterales bacterium]
MSAALSVLDLAPVAAGRTAADALAGTTRLARRADELGFRRFWVAEHHNIPSVASTAPEVLIAHLAANTERSPRRLSDVRPARDFASASEKGAAVARDQ